MTTNAKLTITQTTRPKSFTQPTYRARSGMRLEGMILSRSAGHGKTAVFIGIFDQKPSKNSVSPDSGKQQVARHGKPLYL